MAQDDRTGRDDALLLSLAAKHGSVESLLDSFFDFLHRKTDFYVVTNDPGAKKMGFLPGVAEQKVLKAFRMHPFKNIDAEIQHSVNTIDPMVSSSTYAKQSNNSSRSTSRTVTPKQPKSQSATYKPPMQLTREGKQIPVGNGGSTATYTWTQTLNDVSIQMDVPAGTHSRDLDCKITPTHVRVALRNSPSSVLLEGDFPEKIRADESLWSLENNQTLQLSLEKIKKTWWASALQGDCEIDTSQVDSRLKIDEYDEVTQGALRKAMFDQQQQHRGLPTSDELLMEQMLTTAKAQPNSPI